VRRPSWFLLPLSMIIFACGDGEPSSARNEGDRQSQLNRLPKLPDELAPPTPTLTTLDLVRYHSPVFYHDTRKTQWPGTEYAQDYITKINWTGSYTLVDTLSAAKIHPMTPHVYYSLSVTETHYFIGYFIYHAYRSPGYSKVSHHFDGLTLAVAKKGTSYGSGVCQQQHGCLVAMITRADDDFYQYNDLSYGYALESGSDNVDAPISTTGAGFNGDGASGRHPRVFVKRLSHRIYSCAHGSKASCGTDHDSGIVYYLRQSGTPSAAPDPTTGGAGSYIQRYAYGLIALDAATGDRGPWALRNYRDDSETSSCAPTGTCTFDSWGRLNGSCGDLMPWAWDDPDDGPTYAGDLLCDPVKLFDIQLDGAPFESNRLSHRYLSHPYWTHRVKLSRIRPTTSEYDFLVHLDVTASNQPAGTDRVFGASHWRNRTYPLQDNYPSYGGGSDPAEAGITYGDTSNEHYFCRPNRQDGADTAIRIRGKTSAQIWYFGAWMGTPGTKIVKTDHYTCQSYGCAWVDFEMESNPDNDFLHLL